METYSHDDELQHHGIKGMKWGVRRYQNPDGSLTEKGYKKYYNSEGNFTNKAKKLIGKSIGGKSEFDSYTTKYGNKKGVAKSNRQSVSTEYFDKTYGGHFKNKAIANLKKNKKYDKYFEKYKGKDEFTGDGGEYHEMIREWAPGYKKFEDKMKKKFAEATLKDIGLPVTDKGQKYVEDLFTERTRKGKDVVKV